MDAQKKVGRPSKAQSVLVFLLFMPDVMKREYGRWSFKTSDVVALLNTRSAPLYNYLEELYDLGFLSFLQITRNKVELNFADNALRRENDEA